MAEMHVIQYSGRYNITACTHCHLAGSKLNCTHTSIWVEFVGKAPIAIVSVKKPKSHCDSTEFVQINQLTQQPSLSSREPAKMPKIKEIIIKA